MSVDADNIIIETIKPCEDNEKGYIIGYMMLKARIQIQHQPKTKMQSRLKLLTCWRDNRYFT